MTIIESVTFAIAVLGAILGIINTWRNMSQSKVKLKLKPAHAIPFGDLNPNLKFCLEITNLSTFPITIEEAGVLFRRANHRGIIIHPVFADHSNSWPKKLDSRTSITVYSQLPSIGAKHRIKCAYAKTQCGIIIKGNSPALKQISREQNID